MICVSQIWFNGLLEMILFILKHYHSVINGRKRLTMLNHIDDVVKFGIQPIQHIHHQHPILNWCINIAERIRELLHFMAVVCNFHVTNVFGAKLIVQPNSPHIYVVSELIFNSQPNIIRGLTSDKGCLKVSKAYKTTVTNRRHLRPLSSSSATSLQSSSTSSEISNSFYMLLRLSGTSSQLLGS